MERARVEGVELEYEIRGTGEPVLLIHGSHLCGSFVPLMAQPVLTDEYQLLRYHRRGFRGSSPAAGPVSVAQQATDAYALLEYLQVGPAHVVGHSYGGAIALQLAFQYPSSVHTLGLLEPALLTVPGGEAVRRLVAVAAKLYHDGEWEAAEDLFLGSPKERADIARNVPGGLDQALRDVDTYFMVEAPAHDEWQFDEAEGTRIRCPVLSILGAESSQLYMEVQKRIMQWMPQIETAVLSGATHLLHIQQPAGAAHLLADFFAAHPTEASKRKGLQQRVRRSRDRKPDAYNATVDLLDRNLELGRGNKVAIKTPVGEWTYGQVAAGANRFGAALRDLGVRIEQRVLMVVDDSPEFVTAFFGAIKLGAIPVPVNTDLRDHEYAALLDDTRATVAVVSRSVADTIRSARRLVGYPEHLVVIGESGPGELSFSELVDSTPVDLTPADTTLDDAAFWLYSSGTGGRSKGVVHLQHAMRSCADTYGQTVLGLTAHDTTLSVSKLYYAYGLGAALYLPFSVGAATVLTAEPAQPRMVLHLARRFRPTVFFGVPTSYASMLNAGDRWHSDEWESVRVFVSAAEPLGAALLQRWKERTGHDIVEGIGTTESCHIFISNRIDNVRPGSTGTIVDGYEVRLTDESGQEVPDGQPGALQVKGDSTFAYYWRQRELTRSALIGPWLNTGDIYVRDESGHFSFQGRLDDMLKVGGRWVSPLEVETTLLEHDLVADCAVVGIHDAINLVRLVAFVVPRDSSDAAQLETTLRQHVRHHLGTTKTPRLFTFVDELPVTATGKIGQAELREHADRLAAG